MAALTLGLDVALVTLILLVQFIICPAFADVERGPVGLSRCVGGVIAS